MDNDLVLYAKQNTTDAPMMEVRIDKCIDDTNGPLDCYRHHMKLRRACSKLMKSLRR